jgi:hypothetical protein
MDNEDKIIANVKYVLKQYGVDVSQSDVGIIDIGPDNISLLVNTNDKRYFIAADDYLSEDELYITQAKAQGLIDPTPLKLLVAGPDGEYTTMFDHLMTCKVYVSVKSTK